MPSFFSTFVNKNFRQDIQFLRFYAITFVILNHVYLMQGGYIGVDIFFVISGYLIIRHIIKSIKNGTFSFSRFYLARAWRLLPSAFVVLVTSFIFANLIVPVQQLTNLRKPLIFSWFYVENLNLALQKVNYFTGDKAIAIFEHFWSLGVEEQFYLVIPIVLFIAYFKIKKTDKTFPVVLVTILVLSFVWMLVFGHRWDDDYAWRLGSANYFEPLSRLWEFAIGGLIPFIPHIKLKKRVLEVMQAAAYLGLILCGLLFTELMLYPGSLTVIPVLCTAFIIYAGDMLPAGKIASNSVFSI